MKKTIKNIFDFKFLFYLLILVVLIYMSASFVGINVFTWTDIPLFENINTSSNFVPFKTISTYITALFNGSSKIYVPIKNLLGKLMIYLQMGFFFPFFVKKFNKVRRFIFSMTALLFIVEGIQLLTTRGNFNIDDVILNLISVLIGYGIWKNKRVQRWIRKIHRSIH